MEMEIAAKPRERKGDYVLVSQGLHDHFPAKLTTDPYMDKYDFWVIDFVGERKAKFIKGNAWWAGTLVKPLNKDMWVLIESKIKNLRKPQDWNLPKNLK